MIVSNNHVYDDAGEDVKSMTKIQSVFWIEVKLNDGEWRFADGECSLLLKADMLDFLVETFIKYQLIL